MDIKLTPAQRLVLSRAIHRERDGERPGRCHVETVTTSRILLEKGVIARERIVTDAKFVELIELRDACIIKARELLDANTHGNWEYASVQLTNASRLNEDSKRTGWFITQLGRDVITEIEGATAKSNA